MQCEIITGWYDYKHNNDDVDNQSDYMSPLQLQLGWQLGFRNAEYRGTVQIDTVYEGILTSGPSNSWITQKVSPNPNVFISEGVTLVKGPAYGYIVIDDFNNNVNQNFTQAYANSVFRSSNVMSKISLSQLQSRWY